MDMLTLVTSAVPDRSLGFTLTVVIAGIGIVLFTLFLLVLVFYAFGTIVSKTQAKAKNKAEKKNQLPQPAVQTAPKAQVSVAPAPAPAVEQGISGEVVAAISAAVYSMDGGATVIKSITRKNPISARNPWAQSAVIDNTRPF